MMNPLSEMLKGFRINLFALIIAAALMAAGCSFLGIQSDIEKGRQKALEHMEKAACANVEETKTFVKGSKLEAVDWASICAAE